MAKPKAQVNEDKIVGYGYVGRWGWDGKGKGNGPIGWSLPECVGGGISARVELAERERYWTAGILHHFCRITIEVVRDKRGRTINRRQP